MRGTEAHFIIRSGVKKTRKNKGKRIPMRIVKHPVDMRNLSLTLQRTGKRVGLVPTMGALHKGHLSLLEIARRHTDVSVMSIFVNPTQFAPAEDFSRYPRPFEKDCELAEQAGCDILFAPEASAMYPQGYQTYVTVEQITQKLEGVSRPDHFRGVTTVVMKLLNIISPQTAVFGQKDAQQVIVLKRMVHDLMVPVELLVGATVRESDGLAVSSRNVYLNERERADAPRVRAALEAAEKHHAGGEKNAARLRETVMEILHKARFLRVEYAYIVDIHTLEPLDMVEDRALLAVACKTNDTHTRLIDNTILGGWF